MGGKIVDIFDVLSPDLEDESPIELGSDEKESLDSLKSTLSDIQKKIAEKEKKREETNKKLTSEIKSFIQSEVAKVQIQQDVVERIIEKKIVDRPVHLEPRVIQAPPAPPQIIKEIRVEVQTEKKDTTKYVEASKFNDLLVKIGKLESQLKETRRMAESPIVVGGSGVIGIPPPEPNPVGYVLTVNPDKKAQWKASSGGGLASGTFTVTNPTNNFSFDVQNATIDQLYQVVGTLIQKLQGDI